MRFISLFVAALISVASALPALHAQSGGSPIITYDSRFHPVLARKGMVVSQDFYASEAGLEVLKLGGNAIDAAVATGFALAVTHPQAGNLGGGGFMMVYLKSEDRVIAIDYREMAPAGASRDMFLDDAGNVDNRRARFSLKASGTPGTVMGLTQALSKYGSLPLATVMGPAIRLADEGFPMSWALQASLSRYQQRLGGDPVTKAQFFKEDGTPYQQGELFRQPELAATLKAIAANGADGFYRGWVADRIVETMQKDGGLITHDDLQNYVVKEREPLRGTYRNFEVVTMPPPSSGGVHVIQMLNVLEGWDMKSLGHNSANYIHRLTESMKYAYADRSKYLGDPDYFDVPVAAITDKAYAANIRGRINLERATPSTEIAPAPKLPYESNDTTHFSTMDAAGNMVANTYTLNFTYGNGRVVAGAGFLLNNEMDDFSVKPGAPNMYGLVGGEANAVAPGKRMLSSMTPTILEHDGRLAMVVGTPGGSTIMTSVFQTILNVVDFGMDMQQAVDAPRFHHQWLPDEIWAEGNAIDSLTRQALTASGYLIKPRNAIGRVDAILVSPSGGMTGGADTRGDDTIAGY